MAYECGWHGEAYECGPGARWEGRGGDGTYRWPQQGVLREVRGGRYCGRLGTAETPANGTVAVTGSDNGSRAATAVATP